MKPKSGTSSDKVPLSSQPAWHWCLLAYCILFSWTTTAGSAERIAARQGSLIKLFGAHEREREQTNDIRLANGHPHWQVTQLPEAADKRQAIDLVGIKFIARYSKDVPFVGNLKVVRI